MNISLTKGIRTKTLRSRVLAAAVISASLFASQEARAVTSTWNNGAADNLWLSTSNWSAGVPGATSGFASTDIAVFGAAGSGTIDLGGLINISSIGFGGAVGAGNVSGNSSSFIIGDANDTLNLTSAGAITMGINVANSEQIGLSGTVINLASGTTANYALTNNSNTTLAKLNVAGNIVGNTTAATTLNLGGTNGGTISGVISNGGAGGTVIVTKSGLGNWTFTGNNTYTGATTISGGSLDIGGGTASGTTGGGTIQLGNSVNYQGAALNYTRTGTNTLTVSGLTVAAGRSAVTTSLSTQTINLGAITRQFGGAVDFSGPGAITTSTLNTNGIIGGFATVGGTTWATSGNSTGTYTITGLSSYTAMTTSSVPPASIDNVDVQGSNGTALGTQSLNSLRFNTNAATTLTIGSGQTLTDSSGGILVTSAVGNSLSSITGGAITAGTTAGILEIIQNNTANELNIGSAITNNGVTAISLVKSGDGVLTLSSANTYTGRTSVVGGTLKLADANALGVVPSGSGLAITTSIGTKIDLNGLTISNLTNSTNNFNGGLTNSNIAAANLTNNWAGGAVAGSAGFNFIDGVGDITLSGVSSSARLIKQGTNVLTIANTSNNTQTTLLNQSGTTILNSSVADGAIRGIDENGNAVTVTGGIVRLGRAEQIRNGGFPDAATGILAVYGGTFDLNSFSETVNGLQVGSTDGTTAGTISNTGGGAVSLAISGGTTAFGANTIVATNGSIAATLSGTTVTLNKNTSGTVTLSGANTFTGTANINAGTMIVSSTGKLAAGVATTIASGGILQYDGTATTASVAVNGLLKGTGGVGAVTVGSTGTVNGGDTIGTLSMTSLTLGSGTISAAINGLGGSSNAGTTYDLLSVSGAVTLGGLLTADGSINATAGNLYFLINNTSGSATTGLLNGVAQGSLLTLGGQNFTISYTGDFATNAFTFAGGNDVVLLAAVPEPTSVALLGFALISLVAWRVRARKSAAI